MTRLPRAFVGARASVAALATAAVCVAPLFAHDDDPKILDRVQPVDGPGYRRGSPSDWVGRSSEELSSALGGTFDSSGVDLLAWLPLNQLDNASNGNDCWGYVSPSGREYAIMCTSSSTIFVEVTDPMNPTVVRVRAGATSLWRDAKTYDQYAYSVSEGGGGIQVFDLTNIDSGQVPPPTSVTGPGTTGTHNVAIDEESGFLYRTGGDNNGLRIYSLANPAVPSFVADWQTRYVHDAQAVTYTSGPLAGRQLVFACSGFNGGSTATGLDIIDVTNKSNILNLDNVFYPNPAYSHQGWLSADRQYFYLGDELDEDGSLPTTTHVINVANPSNGVSTTTFTNGNTAIGHNLYTVGNRIYAANYTSGLRVFDATDPLAPTEFAFFDSHPENDGDSFNGLWSVYPYLPSGTIIGSDLERGLFLWTVADPLHISLPNGVPETLDPNGQNVAVTISEDVPGSLVPGSEKLFYDVGNGFVEVSLNALGNDQYEAPFPPTPCGALVNWFIVAESGANGTPFTSPPGAPSDTYASISAGGLTVTFDYNGQNDDGWSLAAPGDDATTGMWTRGNPVGTAAQPEDDVSNPGTQCWFTGQGAPGGGLGDNDVDGGSTTLRTPVMDLSGMSDASIRYWRWYSNTTGGSAAADVFQVDISNNGGASWTNVENVGPGAPDNSGGWVLSSFRVADVIAPTGQVQMRFIASDLGGGSIIEAAIDEFQVFDVDCMDCSATSYCVSTPNSDTSGALMGSSGTTSVGANSFSVSVADAATNKAGLFFYGPNQVQVAFGDGFRCVGGSTFRLLPLVQTDAFGAAAKQVDFNSPPAGGGAGQINAGSTWNFQFWFRDPMGPGGNGFNLSDGLSVSFCP